MEIVAKAAAVVLLCAACSLLIKPKNPEFSFVLSTICAVCVCAAAVGMISSLADFISGIIKNSGLPYALFVPIICRHFRSNKARLQSLQGCRAKRHIVRR